MSAAAAARPRVAFVYHFLPDYREGVFRALLDHPDVAASFVAGRERPGFDDVPATGAIPYREVANVWLGPLLWQRGVVGSAWRREYDVLVFRGSWLTLSTWVAAAVARLRGTPVLFWMIAWRRRESGLRRVARPLYLRLANAVLLYGERARQLGVEAGYPAERLSVIGNSLPQRPAPEAAITEPEGSLEVLWVTRLLPYKKPELLIEALRLAHARGVPLTCTFVGAGEREALEARARDAGLADQVRFTGRLDDEAALDALFARARVVAIPGHAGLTVAHAMLNGVPVVVNDRATANPPEWDYVRPIDPPPDGPLGTGVDDRRGPNGSTFRFDDAESLADELLRWCVERPATTEERRRIAREGAEVVSPERSAEAIVAAVERYAGSIDVPLRASRR